VFFLLTGCIMLLSGLAFVIIQRSAMGKRELRQQVVGEDEGIQLINRQDQVSKENFFSGDFELLRSIYSILIVLSLVSFCQNGVNVSLRPLFFKKFKNESTMLMWGTNLSLVVDPVCSFLTTFTRLRLYRLKSLAVIWLLLTVYGIYICLLGTHPPFSDYEYGGISVVIMLALASSSLAYTRAMCYHTAHKDITDRDPQLGKKTFRYFGIAIQVGSIIGSVILFLLVQFANIFDT